MHLVFAVVRKIRKLKAIVGDTSCGETNAFNVKTKNKPFRFCSCTIYKSKQKINNENIKINPIRTRDVRRFSIVYNIETNHPLEAKRLTQNYYDK